jgi:hypothetical protein
LGDEHTITITAISDRAKKSHPRARVPRLSSPLGYDHEQALKWYPNAGVGGETKQHTGQGNRGVHPDDQSACVRACMCMCMCRWQVQMSVGLKVCLRSHVRVCVFVMTHLFGLAAPRKMHAAAIRMDMMPCSSLDHLQSAARCVATAHALAVPKLSHTQDRTATPHQGV